MVSKSKSAGVFSRGGFFTRFAKWTAHASGQPITFVLAVLVILIWAATGPLFHFRDTWQLVINTATTIITFLMVFLIQNTQNRDSHAVQIKLDELIRAVEGAHNAMLNLEELTDEELEEIRASYLQLAEEARKELERGGQDTSARELKAHLIETGRKGGRRRASRA